MKLITLAALSVLIPAVVALPARGEDPIHVQTLLLTGSCVGCDLAGADLTQAHLIGVDLRDADLTDAILTEANLEGADLEGADLEGADLTRAFLTNANLTNANLSYANFTEAKVYFTEVSGAIFDTVDLTRAEIVGTPISVGGPE
ncbi:MAG: pentapeptide repeat-containing protein [Leptolyngbyaceae cyanobacterium T60_A2020_046]|nr:pentapeptide repeat-containing protein [Leptolyngbyaceae cyanobacterium T60_A2020_046]